MQTDNESNVIVGAKRRRRCGIPTRSCRWRDRHPDRYHGAGLQPRRRPRRGARGQGREEFGGESGPLKLRQLPGLLLEFLNDRQAWKRRPEESGRNYGGNPGQKTGEGQWCAVAHNSAGGAGSRVRAGGCGLPELDLEGEVRVGEVVADEALRLTAMQFGREFSDGRKTRTAPERRGRQSLNTPAIRTSAAA